MNEEDNAPRFVGYFMITLVTGTFFGGIGSLGWMITGNIFGLLDLFR